MGFIYAKEKRKFDKEWEALRALYKALGMDQSAIDSMYKFDLQWFRSRRTYENHTQPFPSEAYIEGEKSSLLKKFPSLVVDDIEENSADSLFWHEVTNKLSDLDIIILTLCEKEGLNQTEIAKKIGCSQAKVSRHLKKIRKTLK